MSGVVELELPLEAYAWTDAEIRTRQQGEDLLAAACMRSYGFDLEPRPLYRGDKALRDARRYGVSDPATASRFGYHMDPAARGPKPPEENYTPAESLVLFGPQEGRPAARKQNGKEIPKGGCWAKSLRDLASEGPEVHPDKEEFADQLGGFTFQESQKDPG
ncbi:Lipoprotein OS=Streptomyces fumanus OX=67302 GN=GCM10018772_33320 PE=4 SV=1 [Streptomyces fumanus]